MLAPVTGMMLGTQKMTAKATKYTTEAAFTTQPTGPIQNGPLGTRLRPESRCGKIAAR